MSKFHILGSGACGFLRLHFLLKDEIAIKYKGGGPKYQNSFEKWNHDGLIWDIERLSESERTCTGRVTAAHLFKKTQD